MYLPQVYPVFETTKAMGTEHRFIIKQASKCTISKFKMLLKQKQMLRYYEKRCYTLSAFSKFIVFKSFSRC